MAEKILFCILALDFFLDKERVREGKRKEKVEGKRKGKEREIETR